MMLGADRVKGSTTWGLVRLISITLWGLLEARIGNAVHKVVTTVIGDDRVQACSI